MKIWIVALLLTFPLLFFSCKKCEDKNSIVVEPIYISETNVVPNRKYIIQSLQEAIDSIGFINTSTINFQQYDILYQYTDADGKGISVCNNVIKDDVNKKYIYTTNIKIIKSKYLKAVYFNNEAVLVPKVPVGYTIDFIITK